jgi:myosin-1
MREKLTASMIFKDRKVSYPKSVSHPFRGDYVRLRQNVKWKRSASETGDDYIVFADIVNKVSRSSGKVSNSLPVLKLNKFEIIINHKYLFLVSYCDRYTKQCVQKLLAISTSSMTVLDQRTLQVKYRVPILDIIKLSLSPYSDDMVFVHVIPVSLHRTRYIIFVFLCLPFPSGSYSSIEEE